jgi:hypothetical protein
MLYSTFYPSDMEPPKAGKHLLLLSVLQQLRRHGHGVQLLQFANVTAGLYVDIVIIITSHCS